MIDNNRQNDKSHISSNFHADYVDVTQHWSAISEVYAGGDSLITAFHNGWEIVGEITREEKWFAGMRSAVLYHIPLRRNEIEVVMPVLNNPYVNRIMRDSGVDVIPHNHKH